MPRFTLHILLLSLGCSSAMGRLAETRDECTARYGGPGKVIPAIVVDSDPEAVVYRRAEVDITVHFKSGRAWHVAYVRPSLTDLDRQKLLAENLEGPSWLPATGERIGTQLFWRSSDGMSVAAALDRHGLVLLEIMTRECAQSLSRQREERILRAPKEPSYIPITE